MSDVLCHGNVVITARDRDALLNQVEAFAEHLRRVKQSAATVRNRRGALRRFVAFLANRGVAQFQDVTGQTIQTYRLYLREAELKTNTVESYLWAVRSFYDYLGERAQVFDNPVRVLPIRRAPQPLPEVISVEQVHRLLNTPDLATPCGQRDRAMLEVLYATGMRRGEMLNLSVLDVDLQRGVVRVFGKGSKERTLPLGQHAVRYLTHYLEHARPIFLYSAPKALDALWLTVTGRPLGITSFHGLICRARRKAALPDFVTTHTLRRCCATHMLQNGASPVAVADMLGHSGLHSLSYYLKLTISDLKRTHAGSKPAR